MGKCFVLINCELGTEKETADHIRGLTGVTGVQQTFGAFDMIVTIEMDDADKLRHFITWKI